MNSTPPRQRSFAGSLLSGVLGGLVVLVLGAVLIATDVIETGEERTVVRESAISEAAASESAEGGRSVGDIARDAGSGIVLVTAKGAGDQSPFGAPSEGGQATGSGFVIDKEGYIVTNDHVVEGSDEVTVSFREGGEDVPAEVKGEDPSSDLALLKVDPSKTKLDPIPLGDSDDARVGDPVIAIGNPFGVGRTVTTGIVSAVERPIDAPNDFTILGAIQTDAAINPGNSGGPLLDARGRVIGVNAQIATGGGSRGSSGVGFAVPINTAKKAIPQLKRSGKVARPFIGVSTGALNDELAKDANVPVDEGAVIVRVTEGSPADEAGLRAGPEEGGQPSGGDVIVSVDGSKVRQPDDLLRAIEDRKPGDTVEIVYFRGKERETVRLKLENRPDEAAPREEQEEQEEQNPLLP